MWNVRGWQRLTAHDNPPLPAARQEFLSWLQEVPQPHRTNWEQRLKGDLDHGHFSVRLELYLHHYFKSNNWTIEIEPSMTASPNKPDFRVTRDADRMLVEAKAVLDDQIIAQETQRLRHLADALSSKLSRDIIIEPLSGLPQSLLARRIKYEIEQRAKTQVNEVLEFDLSDVHKGSPFTLKIIILPENSSTEPGGVGGTISGVHEITTAKRIRDALKQKAGKYGLVDTPFIIGLYVETMFPTHTKHEFDALFGDRVWNLHSSRQVTESRKPNGFFTSVREGKHRHEQVSAVLFYRFKWLNNGHEHWMHVYHNPFALKPLKPDLFPGVSQLVPGDGGTLKWTNGEPDDA